MVMLLYDDIIMGVQLDCCLVVTLSLRVGLDMTSSEWVLVGQ